MSKNRIYIFVVLIAGTAFREFGWWLYNLGMKMLNSIGEYYE